MLARVEEAGCPVAARRQNQRVRLSGDKTLQFKRGAVDRGQAEEGSASEK